LIDRLEERGLVERVRSGEDRRAVVVRLTPAGERQLGALSMAHRDELGKSGPALVELLRGLVERLSAWKPVSKN
jgi:DNA-binding MarR family transcriptional regulator